MKRLMFSLVFFSSLSVSLASYAACTVSPGFENFNKTDFKGELEAKELSPALGIQYYTPAMVKDALQNKTSSIVFVDTRPKSFFDQCRIKGSSVYEYKTAAATGDLKKELVEKWVKEGKTVVFYCNDLKCYRSTNAALQAVCNWGIPADKIGWFGKGVPGLAKEYKRGIEGTNCDQFN